MATAYLACVKTRVQSCVPPESKRYILIVKFCVNVKSYWEIHFQIWNLKVFIIGVYTVVLMLFINYGNSLIRKNPWLQLYWVYWCTADILVLGRGRRIFVNLDQPSLKAEFQASQGHIVRPCLKQCVCVCKQFTCTIFKINLLMFILLVFNTGHL